MLRFAISFYRSPFMDVDDGGNLVGPWADFLFGNSDGRLFEQNLTFTVPKEKITNNLEASKQSFAMVNRGDADTTIAFQCISYERFENITYGTFFASDEWFLMTWPRIRSSIESNGPGIALLRMRMEILLSVFFSLAIILLALTWNRRSAIRENFIWLLFSIFMWKMSVPCFNRFVAGTTIWCLFSIYTLYGTNLNTERTSITSYDKVNKLDNLKQPLLVGQTTICRNDLGTNVQVQVLDSSSYTKEIFQCLKSAECVFFVSLFEYKFMRSNLCSLRPEYLMDHAVYLSPPLTSSHQMMVHNKNTNKFHLKHYDERVYRSFEMGLSKKRGVGSDTMSEAFFEDFTGIRPDKGCMNEVTPPSFSGTAALSNEYFSSFIHLHIFLIMIASSLSIWQNVSVYCSGRKST